MPPKRTTKRSRAAAKPNPSPPPSIPEDNVDQPTASGKKGTDVDRTSLSPVSSAPTADSVEPVDVALFDEEEMPEGADVVAVPPGTSSQYTHAGTPFYAARDGYNALKTFNGQVYSGMAVGGSHTWNYDQGVWKETKEEPDLWKIDYKTTKRRSRSAPKGSGAPVGTEYHWLIVAHQHVKKLDANTYETHLVGSKYKLAHKAAASNSWSVPTVKAQREREIELLDDAKRRVKGLPPVLASEKVKSEKHEKGQQTLETLFAKKTGKSGGSQGSGEPDRKKRKTEEVAGG